MSFTLGWGRTIFVSFNPHFEFHHVESFHGISLPGTAHFVYSNGLSIRSGFPYITHIKKKMADNLPYWPP